MAPFEEGLTCQKWSLAHSAEAFPEPLENTPCGVGISDTERIRLKQIFSLGHNQASLLSAIGVARGNCDDQACAGVSTEWHFRFETLHQAGALSRLLRFRNACPSQLLRLFSSVVGCNMLRMFKSAHFAAGAYNHALVIRRKTKTLATPAAHSEVCFDCPRFLTPT